MAESSSSGSLTFEVENFTKNTTIVSDPDYEGSFKVTGEGTFDKMMEVVHKHLTALLKSNCIRREDFATLYCALFKETLGAALQADSQAADAAMKRRQVQGFNEKYKTDMLQIMLNAWTVGFSASEETFVTEETAKADIPTPIQASEINSMWEKYMKGDFDEGISLTREETLS
jgi:hypothetical protein